jgi:hypothetical protein
VSVIGFCYAINLAGQAKTAAEQARDAANVESANCDREGQDMTFPDQIDKLVTKLTELTARDKVAWKETGNANTHLASIDKFVVTINKGGSEVYGGYSFQILDNTGRAIEGVLAPFSGPEKSEESHANWQRLRDLYEIARRRALHSEKVVSDLLASLDRIA